MAERLRKAEAKPVRNTGQDLYITICSDERTDKNKYFIFAGDKKQTAEGKKPIFMIRQGQQEAILFYRKRIPKSWQEAVRRYLLDEKDNLVPKVLGYATYHHGGENGPGVVYESRYEPTVEIQRVVGGEADGLADFIGLRLLKRERKAGAVRIIRKKGSEPVDIGELIQNQKETVNRGFCLIESAAASLLRPA